MSFWKEFSLHLSDYWLAFAYYAVLFKRIPNFKSPRTFNEKLGYIKLYNRNPLRELIVDRIRVRDYCSSKCPDLLFPKIHWYGEDLSQEVFDMLPGRFVAKASHGSRMVRIVDRTADTFLDLKTLTAQWMQRDYSKYGREWFYKNTPRLLIAEEFLDFGNSQSPPDYKFFCFCGKIGFIQVDLNRFSGHRNNMYDPDFNRLDFQLSFPGGDDIEKPNELDEAKAIAETISEDFDFIRVDLYLCGGKVIFGELTNVPGNGFSRFRPAKWDLYWGSRLPSTIER